MRSRSLPALALGLFLLAASASALPTTYYMTSGSVMSMVNIACAPCTVPVTGSVTLDDNGSGSVALTNVSLAHVAYEVASPGAISIVLARSNIRLGAGSVTGTGSTQTSALFGSTTLANTGTVTCQSGFLTCTSTLGIPDGTFPLPSPGMRALGTWVFDGFGGFSASFVYNTLSGANNAVETLFLFGSSTPVPEPSTGLLLGLGLIALRARHARNSPTTARRLARWSASGGAAIR